MKLNRIKLAKMLLKFGEVERIDGVVISFEGDFKEGLELFVEIEGELKPIEDGKHELKDGRIITTEKGIITAIEEQPKEEEIKEEVKEEVVTKEEKKEEIALEDEVILLDRIKELEELLKERDTVISELTAKIKEYEAKLEMSVQKPAKEAVKLKEIKALKYFINN